MKNESKDTVIGNILRYSSSKVYMQLLGVLSAFIKPKLLSPELFGLFNILNLIPLYASYMHLGTRSSMRYLIPYHEKRNENKKIMEIKGAVFYSSFFMNIILMAALFLFSFKDNFRPEIRFGLMAMGFVVILQWYYEHHIAILKSQQNFRLITYSNYLKSTVTVILSFALIYLFGIYGLYVTVILALAAVILYLSLRNPLGAKGIFRFDIFRKLVKFGFPIMLFSICSELIRTSDRIIVSYFLGHEQLGYYGIASIVISYLIQIPGAAREVIEPKLMQNTEKNSTKKNITDYFIKPLINTSYYTPFMLGPAFFLIPVIIPLILPRYTPGIVPAQINILGSYFLLLSFPARGIIVANNWQLRALFIIIFALFMNVILSILFLKLEFGLNAIALGSSLSFFILFIGLLTLVKKGFRVLVLDWKSAIIAAFWPFSIMFTLVLLLNRITESFSIDKYYASIINTLIYCIIMFIVVNFSQRKCTLLNRIKLKTIWKR